MEQEWLVVTNSLRSYIEHPEENTAAVFLRCRNPLSQETIERLREEKGLVVGSHFGQFHTITRVPGNHYDVLAKKPV